MSWFKRHLWLPFGRVQRRQPWFGPVVSSVLVALVVETISQTLQDIGGGWSSSGLLLPSSQ
ncbi:MAG: hypothetical protein J7M05_06155 [Anaerolineae bacterium]|nr:hypothetical protein [Anaerolineae bacterium]